MSPVRTLFNAGALILILMLSGTGYFSLYKAYTEENVPAYMIIALSRILTFLTIMGTLFAVLSLLGNNPMRF